MKKGVPLLDLNAVSYKHFMEMGADAAKEALLPDRQSAGRRGLPPRRRI